MWSKSVGIGFLGNASHPPRYGEGASVHEELEAPTPGQNRCLETGVWMSGARINAISWALITSGTQHFVYTYAEVVRPKPHGSSRRHRYCPYPRIGLPYNAEKNAARIIANCTYDLCATIELGC